MQCPKCGGTMRIVTHEGIDIDRCTSCEGLWFDLREHDKLRDIKGSEYIDTGDPEMGEDQDEVRDIDCPRCHTQMVKLAFPDQPHIRYEQCATCGGAYLDAGEFRDLKSFTLAERLTRLMQPFRR